MNYRTLMTAAFMLGLGACGGVEGPPETAQSASALAAYCGGCPPGTRWIATCPDSRCAEESAYVCEPPDKEGVWRCSQCLKEACYDYTLSAPVFPTCPPGEGHQCDPFVCWPTNTSCP